MTSVKEKIYSKLAKLCESENIKDLRITAEEFASELKIKRNTASHYLNQLVKEGLVIKVNTRPVIFFSRKEIDSMGEIPCESEYDSLDQFLSIFKNKRDVFDDIIGSRESLFAQIKQLKSAAGYPGVGLPVLLTGPTGTGKSFLAKAYYKYSVASGYLSKDSNFVHLNCAEYADNPELLSSILFGYKKGAFTGADIDKKGLFDQANNGMLFLDEVHRLNSKGQEKLFEYLDNGIITPIGETATGHNVNVRLIFATTEDVGSTFLQTFIRRIPVQIEIPSLTERPPYEREELVKLFLLQQAKHINKKINISKQILTTIASSDFESNVGQLKNNIILTVASCLGRTDFSKQENKSLLISVRDLPAPILQKSTEAQRIRLTGDRSVISIDPSMNQIDLIFSHNEKENQIRMSFERIIKLYLNSGLSADTYEDMIEQIDSLCNQLVYNKLIKRGEIPLKLFQQLLSVKINTIEQDDDIEFSGNAVVVIAYFFYYRQFNYWILSVDEHRTMTNISNAIAVKYLQETKLADELLNLIGDSLNFTTDVVDRLFLQLYIKGSTKVSRSNLIRCIILAHGYSTASSIATVVNEMMRKQVIDYIDMPMDIDVKRIGEEVTSYIEKRHITTGLILMVDMGSLKDVYKFISCRVDFPIGVITNTSTQSALYVANGILQNKSIQTIVQDVKTITEGRVIYPEQTKKNLIVTTCNTGIGTAKQIKQLLDTSIPNRLDVIVNAYDFAYLKSNEHVQALKHTYNVLAVVGTMDPKLGDVPYIPLEKIILGEDVAKLYHAFESIASAKDVDQIIDTILHNFTIERVINSLTILDAQAVMETIDSSLNKYNQIAKIPLKNATRMALYVHVSCLIERLIRNEQILSYKWDDKNIDTSLIANIKSAFSVMEQRYSVKIPDSEIGYIFDIINGNQ